MPSVGIILEHTSIHELGRRKISWKFNVIFFLNAALCQFMKGFFLDPAAQIIGFPVIRASCGKFLILVVEIC